MSAYHFYQPIEVRYGDLDPQGHVNNAKYLTYFELARVNYFRSLGLWQPGDFLNIGVILAETRMTFRRPILFGQAVRVGVRVARLGNKSLDMECEIIDADSQRLLAEGSAVLVAYDYHTGQTIPYPEGWRQVIAAFEQLQTA